MNTSTEETVYYIERERFTLEELLLHPERNSQVPDKAIKSRLWYDLDPIFAITYPITFRPIMKKYNIGNEAMNLYSILDHPHRNIEVSNEKIVHRLDLGMSRIDLIIDNVLMDGGIPVIEPDHVNDLLDVSVLELEPETRTEAEIQVVRDIMAVPVKPEATMQFYMTKNVKARRSTCSFAQSLTFK